MKPNIANQPLNQPRTRTPDAARRRFKLRPYLNDSGTRSWRVDGYRKDGSRVRENFADKREAELVAANMEAEHHAAPPPEDPRRVVTRLTDDQLFIASQAFLRLESEADLVLAVDYWLRNGKQKTVESPRLDEAFSQFQKWLGVTPALRDRTKSNLALRVSMFVNASPNVRIADIEPESIETWLAQRKVAHVTKDNDRRAVSKFFSWCIDRPRRWAKTNPAHSVRVERPANGTPEILSVDECARLMRAAESYENGRLAPYFATCFFGGLRPEEAQQLDLKNVNMDDREIVVLASTSKSNSNRVITIDDALFAWLSAYKGLPIFRPNADKDFEKVRVLAGFGTPKMQAQSGAPERVLKPWTVDVLRHTAISHHFRKTGSYGLTAEWAGNSEAVIRARYQARVSSADTERFYSIRPDATPAVRAQV